MNYFIINLKSMTQAEKARLHLLKHGIKCTVERTAGKGGCGFTLKIFGERRTVCPLLAQTGISCDIP